MEEKLNYCLCKCGGIANPGRRFIKGHNRKGYASWNKNLTKETDERVRKTAEKMLEYTPWNKNLTKETDERVKRNAEKTRKTLLKRYEDPKEREKISKAALKRYEGPKVRKKISESVLKLWKDLEYRKRVTKAMHKAFQDPDFREKQSESVSKLWQDPIFREKKSKAIQKALQDPKIRKKMSRSMLKLWKDPEFARMMLKASQVKPNKDELKLYSISQSIVPGEFAINVKGNIMILGGKIPDFVDINGQKKLIEYNSFYWHSKEKRGRTREQEEQQRINYFKQYGWSTLIVWENELKNKEKLANRIKEFATP